MFSSLRKLSPRYLLDWRVQAITFIWLAYVHAIDQAPTETDLLPRAAVVTASYLFFLVSLALLKRLWLDKVSTQKSQLLSITIALLVAGLVRGLVFVFLLAEIKFTTATDSIFRVQASVLNSTTATLLGAVIVAAFKDHALAVATFRARQAELRYLRDQLIPQSVAAHEKLVAETKSRLKYIFSKLTKLTPEQFLEKIRTTIDEVVRPISYELDRRPPEPLKTRDLPVESKINWRLVLDEATKPGAIRPVEISVFILLVVISAAVSKFGEFWAAVLAIYIMTFGLFVLWATSKLIDPLLTRFSLWPRVVILSAALYADNLIIKAAAAPIAINTPNPEYFDNFSSFFAMLTGLAFAIGQSALAQSAAVQSAMAAVTQNLTWDTARATELQRQRQRNLARTLHGSIQALLASTYLRAQSDAAKAQIDANYRAKVSKVLISKLDELDDDAPEPASLASIIDQVKTTWQGIATIHVETSPFVGDVLAEDPVCLTSVVDIIPELVFNSIKHGEAKHVFVSVKKSGIRIIEVEVSNDGKPFFNQAKQGLGTQLIAESSLDWSRVFEDGLATTRVLLPFEPEQI